MGFAAAGELGKLRKLAAAHKPKVTIPGPRPRVRAGVHYDARIGKYIIPFMGSDASVVKRTVAALASRNIPGYHIAVYMTLPSKWAVYLYDHYVHEIIYYICSVYDGT